MKTQPAGLTPRQLGNRSAGRLAWLLGAGAALILILLPFHAFLTVWLSQLVGHYTLLRLWKEFLLLFLVAGAGYLLCRRPDIRRTICGAKLTWLIATYLTVQVIWGIVAHGLHQVNYVALGYGLIVNCRFLLFFVAVWVIALAVPGLSAAWRRLAFWPAAMVITFGLLQYFVLPYDFLRHFGYSSATIFPYADINNNVHYIRILSTLRGANPLGAYLVVVLSLVLASWQRLRQWRYALLAGGAAAALALSFSRGAWLGAVAAVAVLGVARLRTARAWRAAAMGVAGLMIIAAVGAAVLHDNTAFQNIFWHTQEHSAVATTSDAGHVSALSSGLHDLIHQPFGRGTGTAGPASVYNKSHPARLAENYFIQIGQETGWLGLLLFVGINVLLARLLWRRRADRLALGMVAALAGLAAVNLFTHAWADDTLAYVFWGLAAMALARPAPASEKQ
ncbi:MAG TPA: O-antigen ligase family protein [Candidatus Saccharimonadales bacterium]|nr:O-antigen ligase family protein [Candidatus Saccharimonadales bacterium]